MAEWFKAHAWKACWGSAPRGFKSRSLRQTASTIGHERAGDDPDFGLDLATRRGRDHASPAAADRFCAWASGFGFLANLVHAYPAPLRVGEENRVEHPLDAMSRNCEQPIME